MSEETRESNLGELDSDDLDLDDLKQVAGGMRVYLLRDVPGRGQAGDVIEVSDGYAKNLLIPKRWAVVAPDGL